jgi:mRNA-degrading endonuclease RelE of RelBE toxin-antitoxin system
MFAFIHLVTLPSTAFKQIKKLSTHNKKIVKSLDISHSYCCLSSPVSERKHQLYRLEDTSQKTLFEDFRSKRRKVDAAMKKAREGLYSYQSPRLCCKAIFSDKLSSCLLNIEGPRPTAKRTNIGTCIWGPPVLCCDWTRRGL